MINFQEALKIVLAAAKKIGTEIIPIEKGCNRVLAQDIFTPSDLPPFNKSAVDGYACRRDDLLTGKINHGLLLLETIPAGHTPSKEVHQGSCSKIMTGAPLPLGADIVIMVEECQESVEGGKSLITLRPDSESPEKLVNKTNICLQGEDLPLGSKVLSKGTLIRPQHIAIIATCGLSSVEVSKEIEVGILSTGSELEEPRFCIGDDLDHSLPQGKIYNSNSSQLLTLIALLGGKGRYYGIAPDRPEETEMLLSKSVEENQIVLLSGGVSEGDFDFVPGIIEKLGFKILFDRIAVQPGKPTTFAVSGDKYIFGLPGNPVSAFVQTLLLVKPLLFSIQHGEYAEKSIQLPMAKAYHRRNSSRLAHIPVIILPDGRCEPIEYNGSAHITALDKADALARIPIGKKEYIEGENVTIILL